MSTGNASLILCAKDPLWINPDPEQTVQQLRSIGLCAETIDHQAMHYYAGDSFFDYITFMGCAPAIKFSAERPDEAFTRIEIIHSPDQQLFRSGQLTRPPRCPHCARPVRDWQHRNIDQRWPCDQCHQSAQPYHYDWRQSAGFGHFFIEITDIYPKEAIPQPLLLDKLEQWHRVSWQFFYC